MELYSFFLLKHGCFLLSVKKKPEEIDKNNPRNTNECHYISRKLQRMSFLWLQLTIKCPTGA